MAKALLGYVGGPDPRLVDEVRRLSRRISDLEDHVMRLQSENDAMAAALEKDELLTLADAQEPALT